MSNDVEHDGGDIQKLFMWCDHGVFVGLIYKMHWIKS